MTTATPENVSGLDTLAQGDKPLSEAAEQAIKGAGKKKKAQFAGRDRTIFILMVAVPSAFHIGLVWIPTILSVFLSFTSWKGIRITEIDLVGFLNYEQIFGPLSLDFWQAVINNATLLVFLFLGPTLLGMFLAYLLDKNIKGSRIYQSIFYTPVVLSLAVVGFIWQSVMYSQSTGIITEFVNWITGNDIERAWLGDQSFVLEIGDQHGISANFIAILVAMAWRHTGYIMVLYLAGMKSVDQSLRESAALDGCNEWQAFRHVLFPTLKPINVVVAVITVIEALRAFDIIFVLNTPRKTEVLSILTTNNLIGEGGGNVGRGSAYAVILFLLCLGFVIWYVTNHYRNQEETV